MNVFLRKLRGVVATGLIWCPVWAALFAVLVSMNAIFLPIRGDVGPIRMLTTIGWVGFVSGGLFGILMSFAESGKAIRSLSLGACRAVGDSRLGGVSTPDRPGGPSVLDGVLLARSLPCRWSLSPERQRFTRLGIRCDFTTSSSPLFSWRFVTWSILQGNS
jgi:hypothetical protein